MARQAHHILTATLGACSEDETEKDEPFIDTVLAMGTLHLTLTRDDKFTPPNISIITHRYLLGNLQKE